MKEKTLIGHNDSVQGPRIKDTKYETREMRIKKFRDKRNKLYQIQEDLTKALVPVEIVKKLLRHGNNILRIKRTRSRVIFEVSSAIKRLKSNIIHDTSIVRTKKGIVNSKKYQSKKSRILNFKNRKKIVSNQKEDLSKALVLYKFVKIRFFNKAKKRKKSDILTSPQMKKENKFLKLE